MRPKPYEIVTVALQDWFAANPGKPFEGAESEVYLKAVVPYSTEAMQDLVRLDALPSVLRYLNYLGRFKVTELTDEWDTRIWHISLP